MIDPQAEASEFLQALLFESSDIVVSAGFLAVGLGSLDVGIKNSRITR